MAPEHGALADGETHESHQDGVVSAEPCDPPEFRRFLDLRAERSVREGCRMIQRTAFVSRFSGESNFSLPHGPNPLLGFLAYGFERRLANVRYGEIRGLTTPQRPSLDLP